MAEFVNTETLFGTIEIKQYNRFEGGRMVSYSYSITRDLDGNETSRTKPSRLSSIGWGSGKPFTSCDLAKLNEIHHYVLKRLLM